MCKALCSILEEIELSKRQLSALSQDKLLPQIRIKYIIYSKIMNCQFPQKQSQRWEFFTQEVCERNAPRRKLVRA